MMTIRRAYERGHANHGWLNAHHTFSFADYHDPRWMEPVHLLQIWIQPERKSVKPAYAERSFGNGHAKRGLTLVASRDGRDGSVSIHQDADLWLARLGEGAKATHTSTPGRHAWVQVAKGEVALNGQSFLAGDGAALSEETTLTLTAKGPAQAFLFDSN